jgi:coenzyme Q-binding protein COQ10
VRIRDAAQCASERKAAWHAPKGVDFVIGFRMIRERYTSRVTLQLPQRIDVTYVERPFRYLNSYWILSLSPRAPNRRHDADVPYRVRVSLEAAAVADGRVVHEAVTRMVAAFAAPANRVRPGLLPELPS